MTRSLVAATIVIGLAIACAFLISAEAGFGALILGAFALTIWQHRLFAVEGYVCLLAVYYWLGIANPFGADIHNVTLSSSTTRHLVGYVVLGLLALLLGARVGHRQPRLQPVNDVSAVDPSVMIRSYRSSLTMLVSGAVIALFCYARLGIPAFADNPDTARAEFIQRLSPFSYYQWLLMEVGIALAAYSMSRDEAILGSRRRWVLVVACCGALLLISGVSSRVSIGTPIVTASIIWWTAYRRVSIRVVAVGLAIAMGLIGGLWLYRIQALGNFTLYNVDFDLNYGLLASLRGIGAAVSIFARTSTEVFGLFVRGDLPLMKGELTFMSLISLLPGHHPGLGLFRVSQLLGYDNSQGTTVSLFGGMYGDFGVAGIVIGAFLLGAVLGRLEQKSSQNDGLMAIFYGIILAYYINMIYGGQFLDASLLWKLWVAMVAVAYCRTGRVGPSRVTSIQTITAVALYGLGLLRVIVI